MGNKEIKRSPNGIYICDIIITANGERLVHLKHKKKEDLIPLRDFIMIIMGCEWNKPKCDKRYCNYLNAGCPLKRQYNH